MTILLTPVPSNSFRSWKVMGGGLEQELCVQERTAEGLAKNKRLGHRLLYRPTDFTRYRIIHSRNPVDYDPSAVKRDADQKAEESVLRVVLAVADSFEEIMEDWEKVRVNWGKCVQNGSSTSEALPAVCGTSLTVEKPKVPYQSNSVETSADPAAGSCNGNATASDHLELTPTKKQISSRSPQESLDAYDLCLIRIIGLWQWRCPVETLVYMVVVTLSWWCGVLCWPVLCLVTICAGLPWHGCPLKSDEQAEGARTLQQLEELLGWRSPRGVVSSFATVVLLEYVAAMARPGWRWAHVVECAVPPVLIVSLLHTGLRHLQRWATAYSQPTATEPPAVKVLANSLRQSGTKEEEEKTEEEIKSVVGDIAEAPLSPLNARETALRDEISPEGPFSLIVRLPIEFAAESRGWGKRHVRQDGLVIWEKTSEYSKNKAVLITGNVLNANVGSLQELLLDDPNFEDRKTTYAYKYDKLLSGRALVKTLGRNEFIVLTRYSSPAWGAAPREVLSCISTANLLTPAQQEALGLRQASSANAHGRELLAFAQCGIHCPQDAVLLPPSLASRQHQRAVAHIYLIMGLEEADGSLTLRLCFDVDPGGHASSLQAFANKQHILKAAAIANLIAEIGPKPNKVLPYVNSRDFSPLLYRQPSVVGAMSSVKAATGDHKEVASPTPIVTTTSTTAPLAKGTDPEVARIAKRFVQELLLLGWELQSDKNAISLWTTKTAWTDKKAVKTVTFVPGVALGDVDVVLNDLGLAAKLDKSIKKKTEVKTVTAAVKVFHTTFLSPMWGVAARDMVTRVVMSYYPSPADCATIGLPSVDEAVQRPIFLHVAEDASEEVPKSKEYQRGRVFSFGVLAEEVTEENGVKGVRLTRCAAVDPGGSLPTAIVDAAVTLQIENTLRLVEIIKQHATATSSTG
ncbi:hypothetical protein DQ04_00881020 [Trypanosoma grayi]|uniref:hypothetical protein n=1 Tax=Trypanosoma grayi TaxID=71804 RepID=UPI0004F47A12|nr:hypothetical protein DQ04_00881020 [Trypanosoma grayi]KEG13634.1 hypothetical protein DQ04_00881020 [Trypanosoma grayi]